MSKSMHYKTRKAHLEFNWAQKVLDAAYIREGEIRVRIKRPSASDLKSLVDTGDARYVDRLPSSGGSVKEAIQLSHSEDDSAEEHVLLLPTASTNLYRWMAPEVGIYGFGKTFFFSQSEDVRKKMADRLSELRTKTRYGLKRAELVKTLIREKADIRQLVHNITNQLQTLRHELLETRSARDTYKHERNLFLEQRNAARSELATLKKMKATVVEGPWGSGKKRPRARNSNKSGS